MTELTIGDLTCNDTLRVYCTCGRIVEYLPGMPRKKGIPETKRIADIRFRCTRCGAISGFRVTIFDERTRGDRSKMSEKVIIACSKLQNSDIVGNRDFVWRDG